MDNIDMPMLVLSLAILGTGIVLLVAAVLVRRDNTRAKQWFGSSVKLLAVSGCFYAVTSLLNLGRLIVPTSFAEPYSTFFLISSILMGVVFIIGIAFRGRPTR